MKNIGLSLNIRNSNGNNKPLMNGNSGSTDFQIGMNDRDKVAVLFDGKEITADQIGYRRFPFNKIRKLRPYLYEVWFDDINYEYAEEYLLNTKAEPFACSAIRKRNFYGRSFDWFYNSGAEFVVHTSSKPNRFASVGIASPVGGLKSDFVDSGYPDDRYNLIPFYLVDGINEYGVVCNNNVVPTDKGINYESVPIVEKRESINAIALNRFILDNFKTATEAVNYIRKYVSIYQPKGLVDLHYETHFMVCDPLHSYIIEVIEGQVIVKCTDDDAETSLAGKPYMTNFYVTDVRFESNGKVITPEEGNAYTANGVSYHGAGLERYNYLVDRYSQINTFADMKETIENLRYTKTYDPDTSPYWYSEYVAGELTLENPISDYGNIKERAYAAYSNRSREDDGTGYYGTWHSTHAVIYDIDKREMHLFIQEDYEDEIVIQLDGCGFPQCTATEDGKYRMTATVADGVVTYAWEADDDIRDDDAEE